MPLIGRSPLELGDATARILVPRLGPLKTSLLTRAVTVGVYEGIAKSDRVGPLVPPGLYIPAAWSGRAVRGPVGHHQMRISSPVWGYIDEIST